MMYDYNYEKPPEIFHIISKKKAWLWKPNCWNEGSDTWEYKYVKPDSPTHLIYASLP